LAGALWGAGFFCGDYPKACSAPVAGMSCLTVIPAKAGIQRLYAPQEGSKALDSGFRRNDGKEIGTLRVFCAGLKA